MTPSSRKHLYTPPLFFDFQLFVLRVFSLFLARSASLCQLLSRGDKLYGRFTDVFLQESKDGCFLSARPSFRLAWPPPSLVPVNGFRCRSTNRLPAPIQGEHCSSMCCSLVSCVVYGQTAANSVTFRPFQNKCERKELLGADTTFKQRSKHTDGCNLHFYY